MYNNVHESQLVVILFEATAIHVLTIMAFNIGVDLDDQVLSST